MHSLNRHVLICCTFEILSPYILSNTPKQRRHLDVEYKIMLKHPNSEQKVVIEIENKQKIIKVLFIYLVDSYILIFYVFFKNGTLSIQFLEKSIQFSGANNFLPGYNSHKITVNM